MLVICYEKDGQKVYETESENVDILSWYNSHPDYKNVMVFGSKTDLLNRKIETYKRFLEVCEQFEINPMDYGRTVKLTQNGIVRNVKLSGIITRCTKYKISWEFCDEPNRYIRTTPEYARYLLEHNSIEEN